MKKIILFLVFFFCFLPCVYADTNINYDSYYNLSVPEDVYDFSTIIDRDNTSLSSFLDSLTNLHSDYYKLVIIPHIYQTGSVYSVNLVLIPNDISYIDSEFFGVNSTSTIESNFRFLLYPSSHYYYTVIMSNLDTDNIYNSTSYNNFLNCYVNSSCNNVSYSKIDSPIKFYSSNNFFNNDSNYLINREVSKEFYFIYYSNVDLVLSNSHISNNSYCSSFYNCFYKSIHLNGDSISFGTKYLTYYDLYKSSSPTFPIYSNSLEDLYIGAIPKNQISNFYIDLSFNSYISDYSSKIYFSANYFGRINHNNEYYTYEKIDCSDVLTSWAIDDTEYVGRLYYNGLSCASDLTDYDNIYIKIQTIPKEDNFNRTLFNLSLSSNYGSIYGLPTSIGSFYGIEIFEDFTDLSNTFSILLSSNRNYSRYYSISDNDNIFVSMFSKDGLTSSTNNILYESTFGSDNNLSLLLYNLPSYYNGLTNLKLFIDSETMISLSNNYSYSYYDSNGSVSNGVISPNDLNITINDNSYDISYYFGVVNSYIDSLSSDLYQLHVVLQEGYDLIPEPFSSLLLVLFILACVSFILILIRSD